MNNIDKILIDAKVYPAIGKMYSDLNKFENFNNEDLFKLGFVFFGSDTLYQNEVLEILKFLETKQIYSFSIKAKLRLEQDEIERLFLYDAFPTINNNNKFKWWIINETITAGSVLGVLVYWDKGDEKYSCLDFLHDLKGYGDPFKGKVGTIRNDFSAISFSMNLIHTPDNYACLIKDASPFYSLLELDNFLRDIKNMVVRREKEEYAFEKFCVVIMSRNNIKASIFRSIIMQKVAILLSLQTIEKQEQLKSLLIKEYYLLSENKKADWEMMLKLSSRELDIINEIKQNINLKIDDEKMVSDCLLLSIYNSLCNFKDSSAISKRRLFIAESLGAKIPEFDKTILINYFEQS